MQYVSPITKDNDIVNKKYVDESVSAVNSEIEKVNTSLETKADKTELEGKADKSTVESLQNEVNSIGETVENKADKSSLEAKADNEDIENIQAQLGNLANLETTSKDNFVGAINEVMSNIPDLSEVTSQIGTLANLTTEDKTNLVNAINEVASKGGGVNMTATTLYSGSYSGNTFTESTANFDIVVVCGTKISYSYNNYGYILSSPIMFFPKLNLTYYTASFSLVNYESNDFLQGDTPYYRLNDKSLSIGISGSQANQGTITVYGIKLGG